MKYVYPAVFTPEDGKMLVSVPDLKGCHTFGDDLAEAIEMAVDAARLAELSGGAGERAVFENTARGAEGVSPRRIGCSHRSAANEKP